MRSSIHLLRLAAFAVVASLLLLLVSAVGSVSADMTAVRAIMKEREDSLSRIVANVEHLQFQRCSALANFGGATTSSSSCNIDSCSGGSNLGETSSSFSTTLNVTSSSTTTTTVIKESFNRSTVRFSPKSDFDNVELQAFLSYGGQYDQAVYSEYREITKTTTTTTTTTTNSGWVGLGHWTGASRWYPGNFQDHQDQQSCESYDPRLRSWYVSSASGPKDVVLLLDISGSMTFTDCDGCPAETTCDCCTPRMNYMKAAAKALLDTLTPNDFFAVVKFAGAAQTITSATTTSQKNVLIRATAANILSTKAAIDATQAAWHGHDENFETGTDFEDGFSLAYRVLENSRALNLQSGCKRMILLVTDGEYEGTGRPPMDVLPELDRMIPVPSARPSIMTFSMGPDASTELPKRIACAYNGIWQNVAASGNLLDQMSSYYQFLAYGSESSSTVPRWVEPYTDAFGLGRMTTVSRPVYDRTSASASSLPVFIGVASIDVPLAHLLSTSTKGVPESELAAELTQRGSACPNYAQLTTCQLQRLRSDAGYQCPNQPTVTQCRAAGKIAEVTACASSSSSSSSIGRSTVVSTMMCGGGGGGGVLNESSHHPHRTSPSSAPREKSCCVFCMPYWAKRTVIICCATIIPTLGLIILIYVFSSKRSRLFGKGKNCHLRTKKTSIFTDEELGIGRIGSSSSWRSHTDMGMLQVPMLESTTATTTTATTTTATSWKGPARFSQKVIDRVPRAPPRSSSSSSSAKPAWGVSIPL